VFALLCLIASGYAYSLLRATTTSSANFAGKALADRLTTNWHQCYHTPLYYVAGNRFLAGSLAYYSTDHPSVWIEWNAQLSPWIHESQIKQYGAIFIFYANQSLPTFVNTTFSTMTPAVNIHLPWLRNVYDLPPDNINVIFVPPAGHDAASAHCTA
jgi:hypothetical protein